jgi:hypothetical protein
VSRTRVSIPCSVFTRMLPLAMRLAAIDSLKIDCVQLIILDRGEDYSQEGNDGGKTLWHATRMETAKVTQLAALPLYVAVIPTILKKTITKRMAIVEIVITK